MPTKRCNYGKWLLILLAALAVVPMGCTGRPTQTPVIYSLPQLVYRLEESFGELFWCDPDFYPVGRPEQEMKSALEQFPIIRADEAEFTAILEHKKLANKSDYTNEEKLLIYREHKKLTLAVQMISSGNLYQFILRVGEGQGYRYEGAITLSGEIKVLREETSFNTCPICLAHGTLIDTPDGQIPVEQLGRGMTVWTLDSRGQRIAAQVLETAMTSVPTSFEVVKVTLKDGRSVTASPGHPSAEGRLLGDYMIGDTLDGGQVIAVEYLGYDSGATYGILPSGGTGLYWANGVLLRSTLKGD